MASRQPIGNKMALRYRKRCLAANSTARNGKKCVAQLFANRSDKGSKIKLLDFFLHICSPAQAVVP